jgi:hypothetical protein
MGSDTERNGSTGDASMERSEKTSHKGKELRPNNTASHDAAKTQIPQQEFQAFMEEYFGGVDEENFRSIVRQSSTEDIGRMPSYGESYEQYRDLLMRNLVGCLIAERDVEMEEIEVADRIEHVEGSMFGDLDVNPFFSQNKVLESFSNKSLERLMELYERQVESNNRRRRLLEEKLRGRLLYMAYWSSLRAVDAELDSILARAKKSKRKKLDFDVESVKNVLDRRERFIRLFQNERSLEDDYARFEDLFDPSENVVPPAEYGIEPFDYFD